LVLGYYLSQRSLPPRYLAGLFILVGTSITFLGTIYLSVQDNQFNEFLYGYLSPNVLLSSIGLFLLFRSLSFNNKRFQVLSTFVNNHSYGIYLVHILILELLHYVGINWQFIHPAIGLPVAALSCLVLSIVTIYGLTKIKFGHYISG
jgi:surface polysaccharide O-acyltransferase-like enzyme